VFRIELSAEHIRMITAAPGAEYQAARWVKHFHQADYSHIGIMDHRADTKAAALLAGYGFIRVPRFELNSARSLLQTHGPLLIRGSLSHFAHHEEFIQMPEGTLVRVGSYQERHHAVVVNGYVDGFRPKLLYRDPAHPLLQFVIELARLHAVVDEVFYLSCPVFPKPCAHVVSATR
jgi:hypothetical protein